MTNTKENEKGNPFVIAMIELSVDEFDHGVSLLVAAAKQRVRVSLFASRWDNDKREIWEIPEARDLFLRTFDKVFKKEGQAFIDILSRESLFVIEACRNPERVIVNPSSARADSFVWDNFERSKQ